MNIILFDHKEFRLNLLPFTFTRPVSEIRVGILRLREKWQHNFPDATFSWLTEDYLQAKWPVTIEDENIFINASVCPNQDLLKLVNELSLGDAYKKDDMLICAKLSRKDAQSFAHSTYQIIANELPIAVEVISESWQIFQQNAQQLKLDFALITKGRKSQPINDPHTKLYGEHQIFVEEGAKIRAAIINAESGPVYIGKNAEVHEGALIRGSFALCEGAHVNMGAKIKGDTTIGPYSKVGGEVSNSVIFGFSNKGHDGFLGNSVIGEWCNLGADTNTSNLKNNYAPVKLWNYQKQGFKNTGLQFCGLMMGDHSKCGINTMFNTGTVVGVSANIFGDGFPRNFIPSFAWGGAAGFTTFALAKAFEVAEKMMERREIPFDDVEKSILAHLFQNLSSERNWEHKS